MNSSRDLLCRFYRAISFLSYLKIIGTINTIGLQLIVPIVRKQLLEMSSESEERTSKRIEEDLDSSEILKDIFS